MKEIKLKKIVIAELFTQDFFDKDKVFFRAYRKNPAHAMSGRHGVKVFNFYFYMR